MVVWIKTVDEQKAIKGEKGGRDAESFRMEESEK